LEFSPDFGLSGPFWPPFTQRIQQFAANSLFLFETGNLFSRTGNSSDRTRNPLGRAGTVPNLIVPSRIGSIPRPLFAGPRRLKIGGPWSLQNFQSCRSL
jgi:hypothetical protein